LIIELILMAHMRATHYDGGISADGSSYSKRHVASADYPLGTVLNLSYTDKTTGKTYHLNNMPVRDICGIRGRIDLPSRDGSLLFGPRGWSRQPRGGFPIEVKVVKRIDRRNHSRNKG
jgi:hypothetical protein